MKTNYNRIIDINQILKRKSCFLFGPRQTGKSWLIRNSKDIDKVYNLLEIDTFRSLSRRPRIIRDELGVKDKIIVIDEVQLLPELLNEVHLLIEERDVKFLLTGSSARKLKRTGVNLLGGRASWLSFYPLIKKEISKDFNLEKALSYGTLPSIYSSTAPSQDLKDYVELYLREEIAGETAIRQLPVFSRFLDIAALCNSELVNYSKIGNDAQISPTTVREYFKVLEDTLIIRRLPAWRESKTRKAVAKDKYYFFDIGVARYLQSRDKLTLKTEDFGSAFETYIFHELSAYCSYVSNEKLSFWRTSTGFEVDFLIDEHTAIEVKGSDNINQKHLKGLNALKEEGVFKRYILISLDSRNRTESGIEIIYYEDFLNELWSVTNFQ